MLLSFYKIKNVMRIIELEVDFLSFVITNY